MESLWRVCVSSEVRLRHMDGLKWSREVEETEGRGQIRMVRTDLFTAVIMHLLPIVGTTLEVGKVSEILSKISTCFSKKTTKKQIQVKL